MTRFGVITTGIVALALLAGAVHFSMQEPQGTTAYLASEAPDATAAPQGPISTTRPDRHKEAQLELGTSARMPLTDATCNLDRHQACTR